MDQASTLDRAHEQLYEILLLLRSRGTQVQNDVVDLIAQWNDARGQEFARGEVAPLLECRDKALAAVRACLDAGEKAKVEVTKGEQMLAKAVALFEEISIMSQTVAADSQGSRDHIGRAILEAREGQFLARHAQTALTALGQPK